MKSNMLRKSGLGLLIVAGAMVPMASSADNGSKYGHQATGTTMDSPSSYKTGDMYLELQNIQSSRTWSGSERGAQGPIRTERLDSSPSERGDMYFDLKNIQSSKGASVAERGAQGPIRTDSMDSPSSRGDMYFELKNIQSWR
ncbi:MAG TPA: hypothetical protein VJ572_05705 [Azonexus sp.]|nr:hypothetical protein [Azonexus sp.]